MITRVEIDHLLNNKEYYKINSEFIAATQEERVNSHLSYGEGVARYMQGDYISAIFSLKNAIRDNTYSYWGNYWLAMSLRATGDDLAAFITLEHAQTENNTAQVRASLIEIGLSFLGSVENQRDDRSYISDKLKFCFLSSPNDDFISDNLGKILERLEHKIHSLEERQRDLEVTRPIILTNRFDLRTDYPIACQSNDHIQPRGTIFDNSRSPRFVGACERIFSRKICALDLGCAGGGLVRDFLLAGHRAIGLEGSDASLLARRAEWRVIPDNLKTCDITQPFEIFDAGNPATFDVISAWEVLEHLPEQSVQPFFQNVKRHLAHDGIFVASVALFEDSDPITGTVWHVTLQQPEWWRDQMVQAGLEPIKSPFVIADYVRGSGNGDHDWDVAEQPHMGFHITAKLRASA